MLRSAAMLRLVLTVLCISLAAAPFQHHDPDSIYPVRALDHLHHAVRLARWDCS